MKPSLRRTLKRKPKFWEINSEDIKYIWASCRMDGFDESIEMFHKRFLLYLAEQDVTYILEAPNNGKRKPVGYTSGQFVGPILMIGGMNWLKWATSRNKLETVTHLLNELRKQYLVMFWSNQKDKDFYVEVAKHGVIRRIGTVHGLLEDENAALFQTRSL